MRVSYFHECGKVSHSVEQPCSKTALLQRQIAHLELLQEVLFARESSHIMEVVNTEKMKNAPVILVYIVLSSAK